MQNKIERLPLFPSITWRYTLHNREFLNKELSLLARELYREEPNPLLRSGRNSWQSRQNLHRNSKLKNFLISLNPVLELIKKDLTGYTSLDLKSAWLNINPTGGSNNRHAHSNPIHYKRMPKNIGVSNLSGIYVVHKPPNSGNLVVHTPLTTPPYHPHSLEKLEIDMKEGEVFIFPSWLDHEVLINESPHDRITLSFNIKA